MRQHGVPRDSEVPGAQARLEGFPEWAGGWFFIFNPKTSRIQPSAAYSIDAGTAAESHCKRSTCACIHSGIPHAVPTYFHAYHVPGMSQTPGRVRSPSLHSCDEIATVALVMVVMVVVMLMVKVVVVMVVVVRAAREAREESPYK